MKPDFDGFGLKKLGNNILMTFLRQGLELFVGLGVSVLLARLLGTNGNGQYAIAILLPTMLATFLNLGVGPANVYYIASKRTTNYLSFKSNIYIWALLSVTGLLIGSVCIIKYGEIWFNGVPEYLLFLGIIAFPIILLNSFIMSILQGQQDFKNYNYALLASPSVTFVLSLVLIGILDMDILGAIISFICGQFAGLLVALVILVPTLSGKNESNNEVKEYTSLCLKYGWKAHMSNIMAFVNYRADLFLVNFFLSPASTGIYVIAVQIAERLWILSQVVSTVLLPRLSELHEEEHKRKVLTPLIARWVLFISIIGSIFMALLASPLISLIFGSDYEPAYVPLLWLLPGIALGSMSRVLANDIAARGKPELNFYTSVLVVTTNIFLNVILIPRMGISGAAIATTITYSINTVIKLWLYGQLSSNPWKKSVLLNYDDLNLLRGGLQRIKTAALIKLK